VEKDSVCHSRSGSTQSWETLPEASRLSLKVFRVTAISAGRSTSVVESCVLSGSGHGELDSNLFIAPNPSGQGSLAVSYATRSRDDWLRALTPSWRDLGPARDSPGCAGVAYVLQVNCRVAPGYATIKVTFGTGTSPMEVILVIR